MRKIQLKYKKELSGLYFVILGPRRNVARQSDVVPWAIYNGSFTSGRKIDGQKVGPKYCLQPTFVPAELRTKLPKRDQAPSSPGKLKPQDPEKSSPENSGIFLFYFFKSSQSRLIALWKC